MSRGRDGRDALAATIERLRLEGLAAAYERGISILRDDAAPSTAHAAIVRVFFAAAGIGAPDADEAEKPGHEMTGQELEAATKEILTSWRGRKGGGGSVMD